MAKVSVLVDTDVFIDYFNSGRFSFLFNSTRFTVYYSVVTKKELLSKTGLRDQYPSLEKADALIAASALIKNLPLVTRNKKHFQIVAGLSVLGG